MERVFRNVKQNVKQWEYHQDGISDTLKWILETTGVTTEEFNALPEGDAEDFDNSRIVDTISYFSFSNRDKAQLCILEKNGKYGLYCLDSCDDEGLGVYINPDKEPFLYDDILFSCTVDGICYAGLCIDDKWGIEKIVDKDYINPGEQFLNCYGLTKRRMITPCIHDSLLAAQTVILYWKNHLLDDEEEY